LLVAEKVVGTAQARLCPPYDVQSHHVALAFIVG
jgi:hypothetical protein